MGRLIGTFPGLLGSSRGTFKPIKAENCKSQASIKRALNEKNESIRIQATLQIAMQILRHDNS